MKTLALETSGPSGSVALLDDDAVLNEANLHEGTRTAKGLAPAIQALLADSDWLAKDIEFLAVTGGPGSFTGLRVGITTAKVFAYAANAAVLDVNTLHAIAIGSSDTAQSVAAQKLFVIMDAQRKQLFCAEFDCCSGKITPTRDCRIVDAEEWIRGLNGETHITGSGLRMKTAVGGTVVERVHAAGQSSLVLAESTWDPSAAAVGKLGLAEYKSGRRADLWKLSPNYFRLSAAEEKAAAEKRAIHE